MQKAGRSCALAVTLLAFAVLLSACQSQADKLVYKANETAKNALKQPPDQRKKMFEQARDQVEQAVKLDPNNKDGYLLLCQLDDVLGLSDAAAHDYQAASALDPTNQKLLNKARYYRYLQQIGKQADDALDKVKSGDAEQGMSDLKDALKQTKSPSSRNHVIGDLQQAVTSLSEQGDKQVQDKKYIDAAKTYEQAVRGYILIAEAQSKQSLDPAADKIMHEANDAAQKGGAPDMMFRLFNDVLGFDPDNKVANLELAQVYIHRSPPDYSTAADLEERAGASDKDVKELRAKAKRQGRRG